MSGETAIPPLALGFDRSGVKQNSHTELVQTYILQETGFGEVNTAFIYIWLMFPFFHESTVLLEV